VVRWSTATNGQSDVQAGVVLSGGRLSAKSSDNPTSVRARGNGLTMLKDF
jgi:hypothetical protein